MTRVVDRRAGRRDERGMVLVYFAISLTMLLAMAAFSVDVGAWYQRSERIQKAADAAALAGVVWMPDNFTQAVAAARATATANGFTDGANGGTIHVSVSAVTGQPKQLAVTIKDDNVAQYFSKAFISNIHEQRVATAEYSKSVPLGSPENSLGTGPACGNGANATCVNNAGFWLAINGYCTAKEDGDLRASRFGGTRAGPPAGLTACPTTPSTPQFSNSSYDPNGYTYDIEVPSNVSGKASVGVPIQVYDAAFKVSSNAGDAGSCSTSPCPSPSETPHITTNWTITNPNGATVGSGTFADGDPGNLWDDGNWHTLYTVTSGVAPGGTYQLHISTLANEAHSWGTNNFGIRANNGTGGGFNECSTISLATCPMVHGEDALSMFISSQSSQSEFYLAQVTAAQEGSNMTISLFDPGDKLNSGGMQVEAPTAFGYSVVPFSWNTLPTDDNAGLQYSGSNVTCICDTNSTLTQPLPGRVNNFKYSDREIQISVKIPAGSSSYQGGWFKIKYTAGGVQDRTTWGVRIAGDPVHLAN